MKIVTESIHSGDEGNVIVSSQVVSNPEFDVKSGLLNFSSHGALTATVAYLNGLSPDEYSAWADKYGITTQRSIFEELVIEESKLDDYHSTLKEKGLRSTVGLKEHTDLYYEMLNKGIIKEFTDSEGYSEYAYANCDPMMSSILNDKGCFMVNDTLIYVSPTSIKQVPAKSLANLNDVSDIDTKSGVKTLYSEDSNPQLRLNNVGWNPPSHSVDYYLRDKEKYRYMIRVYIGIYQKVAEAGYSNRIKQLEYKYWIHLESKQKKALFGGYNYRTVQIETRASWTIRLSAFNSNLQNASFTNSPSFTRPATNGNDVYMGVSVWDGQFYSPSSTSILRATVYNQTGYFTYMSLNYNITAIFEGNAYTHSGFWSQNF